MSGAAGLNSMRYPALLTPSCNPEFAKTSIRSLPKKELLLDFSAEEVVAALAILEGVSSVGILDGVPTWTNVFGVAKEAGL